MNVYSGAGDTPRIAPVPHKTGRMYSAPFPVGGTQCALAATTPSIALRNISSGTGGMPKRFAPACRRAALRSGRNNTIPPLTLR